MSCIGKKVIVRGENSGVYFGTIVSRNNSEVELANARNLWYWDGACSVLQIATDGVKNKLDSKFTVVVESILLLDAIEIIPCTDKAIANIETVPVWKR